MHTVYVISVFLHILAAITWIGGALFIALVLVPLLRRPDMREQAGQILRLSGRRLKIIGWVSLLVLLITGVVNVHCRGWLSAMGTEIFWQRREAQALGLKLGMVGLILVIAFVHDFFIGTRAAKAMSLDRTSPEARRLRFAASWMGRINLLLGIGVVFLGVLLVRGVP
ncbi:MAG: putative copper resistance protein D [Kiritimatiellia bacterium]|jgi:copper resistance protein D